MGVASGTMKRMKKQYLPGSFIISALLVPVLASASTADEIKAQIQSLLSQITALQQQLNGLTANTSTTISASSNSCPNLSRVLSRGSRGSDVISLQQFFIAQGLLSSDSATGFFGSMTETAVQRWQAQNSIVSYGDAASTGYGVVGAKTRAAFAIRCGTKPPIAVSCPIYNACPAGYTANTSTDTNGCTVRKCVPPTITTVQPSVVTTPSISVSGPAIGQNIKRGETLRISWNSQNAPMGSVVTLRAESDTGDISAAITGASWQQPTNGYFDWTVPSLGDGSCVETSPSPCLADGRTYKIKATLLKPGSSGNTTCTGSVCSTTLPGTSAEIYSTAHSNPFTISQNTAATCSRDQLIAMGSCIAQGGTTQTCKPTSCSI